MLFSSFYSLCYGVTLLRTYLTLLFLSHMAPPAATHFFLSGTAFFLLWLFYCLSRFLLLGYFMSSCSPSFLACPTTQVVASSNYLYFPHSFLSIMSSQLRSCFLFVFSKWDLLIWTLFAYSLLYILRYIFSGSGLRSNLPRPACFPLFLDLILARSISMYMYACTHVCVCCTYI